MGLGKTAGGSITAATCRAVGKRQNELILFANGKVYTRSEKESAWIDRGRFESIYPTQKTVSHERTDMVLADRAETGNVIVYAWQRVSSTAVVYAFYDKVTGAVMDCATSGSTSVVVASAEKPRCLAVGGQLHVYYRAGSEIKCDVVDPTDVYGTAGAGILTVATGLSGSVPFSPYDVCVMNTSAFMVHVTTAEAVKFVKIGSNGSITTTVSPGRNAKQIGGVGGPVACHYNATSDRVAVVRCDYDSAFPVWNVYLDWVKADCTDDGIKVNLIMASEAQVKNVAVASLLGQTAHVIWDFAASAVPLPATPHRDQVRKRAADVTGAVGTVKVLARQSFLCSRAAVWNDNGTERPMVIVGHSRWPITSLNSDLQPCHILLDTNYVVGETNGSTNTGDEVGILARFNAGEGAGVPYKSDSATYYAHIPQIEQPTSGTFACALGYRRASQTRVTASLDTPLTTSYLERGVRDFTWTMGDSRAFRMVEEGGSGYGPGGYVWMYDGQRVVESNFLLFTEGVTGVAATSGGLLVDNTPYYFRFYWEWRTAAGEIERSTHSGNIAVTTGASGANQNKVTFTVPTLPYTNKTSVVIAGYSSTDGEVFHRFTAVDPADASFKVNDTNNDTITVICTSHDPRAEIDYLAGDVLDNVAPPMTTMLARGQARLWLRDPDDTSLLRYAKQRKLGGAIAFNDAQSMQTPDGGEMTDVEVTESWVYVWKKYAIYLSGGQGPDDHGDGAFTDLQRISDIGCDEIRSVLAIPKGYIFHSPKGFYLVGKTGGVEFVGLPVADYNSLTCIGAQHIVDQHQARFFFSGTTTCLVYDYLIEEWSVWVLPANPTAATVWMDTPVHLDTASVQKTNATFLDDGADALLKVTTGWIKPADLGGFVSVRTVYVLGEIRAASIAIRVSIAYDYNDTAVDSVLWTEPGSAVAGDPLKIRVGLSRRKITALKITVEENSNGPAGEAFKLTGMQLELGMREGVGKLPSAYSK